MSHKISSSSPFHLIPIILALALAVLSSAAGTTLAYTNDSRPDARLTQSDDNFKNDFEEACEEAGGWYYEGVDDTIECWIGDALVVCDVFVVAVSDISTGCYRVLFFEPDPVGGSDPEIVTPAFDTGITRESENQVVAPVEPTSEPGPDQSVIKVQVVQPVEASPGDGSADAVPAMAPGPGLTADTFETGCEQVGGTYDKTASGKWRCTLPSGTVVECDPIEVDLLGGWKGCKIVETVIDTPDIVDRPANDQIVQADPGPTATASATSIVPDQPVGDQVVEVAPVPTQTPIPTAVPVTSSGGWTVTDRPAGDQVVEVAPVPTQTLVPTSVPDTSSGDWTVVDRPSANQVVQADPEPTPTPTPAVVD